MAAKLPSARSPSAPSPSAPSPSARSPNTRPARAGRQPPRSAPSGQPSRSGARRGHGAAASPAAASPAARTGIRNRRAGGPASASTPGRQRQNGRRGLHASPGRQPRGDPGCAPGRSRTSRRQPGPAGPGQPGRRAQRSGQCRQHRGRARGDQVRPGRGRCPGALLAGQPRRRHAPPAERPAASAAALTAALAAAMASIPSCRAPRQSPEWSGRRPAGRRLSRRPDPPAPPPARLLAGPAMAMLAASVNTTAASHGTSCRPCRDGQDRRPPRDLRPTTPRPRRRGGPLLGLAAVAFGRVSQQHVGTGGQDETERDRPGRRRARAEETGQSRDHASGASQLARPIAASRGPLSLIAVP